eukprot:8867_1
MATLSLQLDTQNTVLSVHHSMNDVHTRCYMIVIQLHSYAPTCTHPIHGSNGYRLFDQSVDKINNVDACHESHFTTFGSFGLLWMLYKSIIWVQHVGYNPVHELLPEANVIHVSFVGNSHNHE